MFRVKFNIPSKLIFVTLVTFLDDISCLFVFCIYVFICDMLNVSMEPIARHIATRHFLGQALVTRGQKWRAIVVYLKWNGNVKTCRLPQKLLQDQVTMADSRSFLYLFQIFSGLTITLSLDLAAFFCIPQTKKSFSPSHLFQDRHLVESRPRVSVLDKVVQVDRC